MSKPINISMQTFFQRLAKAKRQYFVIFIVSLFLFQSCHTNQEIKLLQITSIYPAQGIGGTEVKISGKGFSTTPTGNIILFNGKKAIIKQVISDTLILVTAPENVTSGLVQIKVGESATFGPMFEVLRNPNPPVLKSISPQNAEIGEIVTLLGLNFKTGSDITKNIVRIGGEQATVINATETQLKVAIPGLAIGSKPSVSVSISGATSNNLELNINSFEGNIFCVTTESNSNLSAVVEARADGSGREQFSLFKNTTFLQGSTLFPNGISYQKNLNTLYVSYDSSYFDAINGSKHVPVVGQISRSWNDYKKIYSGISDIKSSNFNSILSNPNNNKFYSWKNGSSNISVGTLNGTNPLINFGNSNITLPDYLPFGLGAVASKKYIYSIQRFNDPISGAANGTLRRIPLDESSPEELLSSVVIKGQLNSIQYNESDNSIYIISSTTDLPQKASLYQFSETDNSLKLIVDDLLIPVDSKYAIRNLAVLSTAAGIKVYFLAPDISGETVIWLVNLKASSGPFIPVVIYDNLRYPVYLFADEN